MFLVVVPDEALKELSPAWSCCGWQLENTDFDAAALQEALINPQSAAETGYASPAITRFGNTTGSRACRVWQC